MNKKTRKLYSSGDAAKELGISRRRFDVIVKQYKIPFQLTGNGRIFESEDIKKFQLSPERVNNLRFRSKAYRKNRK